MRDDYEYDRRKETGETPLYKLARPYPKHCYCPSDCNCRYQDAPWHRFSYCGCKAHPMPLAVPPVTDALHVIADAMGLPR